MVGAQDSEMDAGDAFIGVPNISVVKELQRAREVMGICAQFDCLVGNMSPVEHFRMYARIRGVPPHLVEKLIKHYVTMLDLDLKKNANTKTLSGGNKRKLSVGLSLFANPQAVFLDEPTTGMDVVTRRFVWEFLNGAKKDRAIVLTTHSMEEADALSTRISIMVSGAVRMAGTSQELKSSHGLEFSIGVRLVQDTQDKNKVLEMILKKLKTLDTKAYMKEDNEGGHSLSFAFSIPSKGSSLADIFEIMLQVKESTKDLEDFSVSQTSLEQIFIDLVSYQESSKEVKGVMKK